MKRLLSFLAVSIFNISMPTNVIYSRTIEGGSDYPIIQTTILNQNFETPSGWNGSNPPTGWTIMDSGVADAVWDSLRWYRSSAWGGGVARVRGNSLERYNNDWIISPTANYSSATACTLFFRHYYNDTATEPADSAIVILSDDDGITWEDTVFVYAGFDRGSETVPDTEFFDISSFAAGKSNIKAAFQYVKRQLVAVNVWQVDDIQLRADGSPLVSQNFNGSWSGDNPPSGWIIAHPNVNFWDNNDWHQFNDGVWGNVARIYYSPIELQREWLATPSVNLSSGVLQAYLIVKQWYDDFANASDTAYILGSIDSGSSWPFVLGTYFGSDHGSQIAAAYDTISITDWAVGQANVKISFLYVGSNAGKWYIDDVKIEGVDRYQHDAAVIQIIDPGVISIDGYSWPVKAVVENAGLNSEIFDVVYRISDSTDAMVYSDTIENLFLASAADSIITFNDWNPGELNQHNLICYTRLSTDADHANDTMMAQSFTYGHRGSGGPIQKWIYRDNITGNGPDFNWIDITGTGTMVSFSDSDDGNSGMIEMGFEFALFNQIYDHLNINVNGWLSFEDSTSNDNSPSIIPESDGPNSMIAGLWADLHTRGGQVYYLANSEARQFIVQYDNVEFESISGATIQMQVIIDGNNKSIKIQYNAVTSGFEIAGQTIGIENNDETVGLAFNNNGEIGQTPVGGLAVTFQFIPDHDIALGSFSTPPVLIFDGESYSINVNAINNGSNSESFTVAAEDGHSYSNSINISDLASFDSTEVIFSGWNILTECEDYIFAIASLLVGDEDNSNDSASFIRFSAPSANVEITYDSGVPYSAWYSDDTTDVIANMFATPYQGATISAAAFKFSNYDDLPGLPDAGQDTIVAAIFLDQDDNGIPEAAPIHIKKIKTAKTGWTIWDIGCDTSIILNCEKFWIGWSVADPTKLEAIVSDITLDHPAAKWVRSFGSWQLLYPFGGDYMIRAYLDGDPATAPNALFGESPVYGVAQPNGSDTLSNTLANSGTGCDLDYTVKVYQIAPTAVTKLNKINENNNQFVTEGMIWDIKEHQGFIKNNNRIEQANSILDTGGPDSFGYAWIDSDDPEGPVYTWLDITGNGTEIIWDYGTADDGWTDLIPMGMTFSFYGIEYDDLAISSNGYISFQSQALSAYTNDPIPLNTEPNALIAVNWDDLQGDNLSHCYYYYDNIANSFIISWVNWSYHSAPGFRNNFQIVLSGYANSITLQYGLGSFRSFMSVGIENEFGTDGIQVAKDSPYLHNNLAVLFKPPILWLSTDLSSGSLLPTDPPLPFNIYMSAALLPVGLYNGAIVLQSNDPDNGGSTILDVHFEVEGICAYVPGDVNTSGNANGLDVTFMVNYFRGGDAPRVECPACGIYGQNMIYPQGDVNGSCSWNGIDVSYFVNYLKGIGPQLTYCASCPPAARITGKTEGKVIEESH